MGEITGILISCYWRQDFGYRKGADREMFDNLNKVREKVHNQNNSFENFFTET